MRVPTQNKTRQGYCADTGCPSWGGGGSSGVCSATDALGNTTVTRFDLLGRATETISPTGSVTTTAYDSLGRQAGTIDALGNETHYTYDSLGRLWKVTDALGGVTEYGFDERGNRTSVKDAIGNVTHFEYDLNNRLTKEINPLGVETTFTYNATGSRATRTDGNGFTTIYRYDNNRRLSEIEYPDGKKTQYTFDAKGNKTFEGYFDPALSFAATSRTFTYDDLNRLRSMTDSSLGKTILYEFDENGNRSKIVDAEGKEAIWEHDRNNRPIKVTDGDGQVTRYEYDAAGRRTKDLYGDGVWTEYVYDASSQLLHMVTRDRTNQILQGWHYVYDLRGNRTSKTDHAGNVEAYLYDGLGRLTQTTYSGLPAVGPAEAGGRIVKWTYDSVGNRLTQDDNGSITTYTYNAANQIVGTTSPTSNTWFGFDNNGNMTQKGESSGVAYYTWDFENRLRQVSSQSGVTNMGYDASGIREYKESGGVRTDYLIDTVSVLAEYEAGLKKAAYTLGPRIDEIISAQLSAVSSQPSAGGSGETQKYWYMADALGSVTALADKAGNVVKTYRYGAWGEQTLTSGIDVRNSFTWTARELDMTGLQFNRARYYSVSTATFLTVDPFKHSGHPYVYAEDDPVFSSDPFGLKPLSGPQEMFVDYMVERIKCVAGWEEDGKMIESIHHAGRIEQANDDMLYRNWASQAMDPYGDTAGDNAAYDPVTKKIFVVKWAHSLDATFVHEYTHLLEDSACDRQDRQQRCVEGACTKSPALFVANLTSIFQSAACRIRNAGEGVGAKAAETKYMLAFDMTISIVEHDKTLPCFHWLLDTPAIP